MILQRHTAIAAICLTVQSAIVAQDDDPIQRAETIRNRAAEFQKQRERPIVFYGKVVDQDSHPVPDAVVDITIEHYSPAAEIGLGSRKVTRKSDSSGSFTVDNITGISLNIDDVHKDGYVYERPRSEIYYQYWRNRPMPTDPANPAIYFMRKKGPPNLVLPMEYPPCENEYGKTNYIDVVHQRIWNQDTPEHEIIKYDRTVKKYLPVVSEDLRFECAKTEDGKSARLVIRPSVEGGGVQEAKGASNLAPADGYGQEVSFVFPIVEEDSKDTIDKYVVARIRGTNYVRLDLSLRAMPEKVSVRVKTWYNPEGSQNLEYDEETFRAYQRKQRQAHREADQKRWEEIQKEEKEEKEKNK